MRRTSLSASLSKSLNSHLSLDSKYSDEVRPTQQLARQTDIINLNSIVPELAVSPYFYKA